MVVVGEVGGRVVGEVGMFVGVTSRVMGCRQPRS
jgi:hypothetical protein